ncbi:MAG: RNA polymerase sigma-70 factor [bacterium]|nr:RNA polymerase sigma-70 factor [bacterium]
MKKEREDFTTLFERCRKPFTQFAYSYMRDWEVAEDIFSEAMIQYWTKRNELEADTNPRAYILTLIKHLSLNYLRHQQVRITVEEELSQSMEREQAFRIRTLQDCDPQELFSEELQQLVRQTLQQLPEQTRLIFFKSRLEGKRNGEIAEEMGLSVKSVEYHITQALKALRKQLKDYLPLFLLLYESKLF